MQLHSLNNERGEGKSFLKKWQIGHFKPNYLMFATNKGNRAKATVYIINNDPTEE